MCSDGMQNIYMVPSGQLYKDGTKTMLPNIISVWTADESATAGTVLLSGMVYGQQRTIRRFPQAGSYLLRP
ncbi:MAG: hypothetical protein ACLRM8_07415 [Alistipes sp.]